MFALSDPATLTALLEEAGFFDIELELVPIRREYASVVDWLGETRDLSRQFATVWAGLGDEDRQSLRDHIAAAAADYADDSGALVLPGQLAGGRCLCLTADGARQGRALRQPTQKSFRRNATTKMGGALQGFYEMSLSGEDCLMRVRTFISRRWSCCCSPPSPPRTIHTWCSPVRP